RNGSTRRSSLTRVGLLLLHSCGHLRFINSFPTRRSSDLRRRDIAEIVKVWDGCKTYKVGQYVMLKLGGDYEFEHNGQKYIRVDRSEEHTSELQSRENLVCRLLLEKKKRTSSRCRQ